MESFEDLGLASPLVEALAAEGIEVPTALQAHAIPVLRRGNSAVLLGSPGAGVLVAYGAPLLERIEPDGGSPRAIVLTGEPDRADALARSLARLAPGHRVGALQRPWALSERSDILFSTPTDLERAIRGADVKVDEVSILVLDGASALLGEEEADPLSAILLAMDGGDLQIALTSDRITPPVRRFIDQHMKRSVFLPPDAATAAEEASAFQRGTLRYRTREGSDADEIPALVAELLDEGAAHVLAFLRSEDRAADIGDLLSLQGFGAGAPGDPKVPVWLGVEPLEVRNVLRELEEGDRPFVIVSVDVPTGPDELDRRHGGRERGGVVLARPRELPHLRRTAREAGYSLEPLPDRARPGSEAQARFLARIEEILRDGDLLPHLLVLEPLLERWGAAEVAAALSVLLRTGSGAPGAKEQPTAPGSPGARPTAWVRLFLSIGERDGVGPGDLLGAILGESGIPGDQVGRIEVRDAHSKVEVPEAVADRVIRALNGSSIRGRSIRADFDRGDGRGAGSSAPTKGSRKGGRSPRPRGGPPSRGG